MTVELLDSRAVAVLLKCNRATVYNLAKARLLEVIVMGGRRWFTQEAVDKFIKEHTLPTKEKQE